MATNSSQGTQPYFPIFPMAKTDISGQKGAMGQSP